MAPDDGNRVNARKPMQATAKRLVKARKTPVPRVEHPTWTT